MEKVPVEDEVLLPSRDRKSPILWSIILEGSWRLSIIPSALVNLDFFGAIFRRVDKSYTSHPSASKNWWDPFTLNQTTDFHDAPSQCRTALAGEKVRKSALQTFDIPNTFLLHLLKIRLEAVTEFNDLKNTDYLSQSHLRNRTIVRHAGFKTDWFKGSLQNTIWRYKTQDFTNVGNAKAWLAVASIHSNDGKEGQIWLFDMQHNSRSRQNLVDTIQKRHFSRYDLSENRHFFLFLIFVLYERDNYGKNG